VICGAPSADSLTIGLYPDLGELDSDERFAVPGMTIGPQSGVHLLGVESKTVLRHFRWMQEYGLDGALVQRFMSRIAGKRAIS
jgi:hypothetical protein